MPHSTFLAHVSLAADHDAAEGIGFDLHWELPLRKGGGLNTVCARNETG